MLCQSGEIQPIHCSQTGNVDSGKKVPENSVIGSTTNRMTMASWPVSSSRVEV